MTREQQQQRRRQQEEEDDDDEFGEGDGEGDGDEGEGWSSPDAHAPPPMLITTVVAPSSDHLRDARRAAGRLERVAAGLQVEWAAVVGTRGNTTHHRT